MTTSTAGLPWDVTQATRKRAHELFNRYELGSVRTPSDLMRKVESIVGKPVRVDITEDRRIATTTALWWELDDEARILQRAWDEPYYQVRGLHHELAHMLFQHPGCTSLADDPAVSTVVPTGVAVRGRTLFSREDTSLITGDRIIEAEAEYLSELLAQNLLLPTYADDDRVFG